MTHRDYETLLTAEQRQAMADVFLRENMEAWTAFMERCYAPTDFTPYVGVPDFCGMFLGIEPDGHTHS